jgi:DNA-binding Lrp family transcriptional regulator
MRRGVGRTQRGILDTLAADEAAGLTVKHLASKLGGSDEQIRAAVRRLKRRGIVVTSSGTLLVWLPKRRLEWLETRAVKSREAVEEITRLAEAVRTPGTGLLIVPRSPIIGRSGAGCEGCGGKGTARPG